MTAEEMRALSGREARLLYRRITPELADAIRACLPLLLAQRERERQGETLLRPATPSDDADMLLHAARHPADEPAELLLRATEETRIDGTE